MLIITETDFLDVSIKDVLHLDAHTKRLPAAELRLQLTLYLSLQVKCRPNPVRICL